VCDATGLLEIWNLNEDTEKAAISCVPQPLSGAEGGVSGGAVPGAGGAETAGGAGGGSSAADGGPRNKGGDNPGTALYRCGWDSTGRFIACCGVDGKVSVHQVLSNKITNPKNPQEETARFEERVKAMEPVSSRGVLDGSKYGF
jgi:hypothetical protein